MQFDINVLWKIPSKKKISRKSQHILVWIDATLDDAIAIAILHGILV